MKIRERDLVVMDRTTGEVLELLDDTRGETFCYFRLTEGTEWLVGLGASEIKVLLWLVNRMTRRNKVRFSKNTTQAIGVDIEIDRRTVRSAIQALLDRGLLKEMRGGYIVSPETFSYFRTSLLPYMIHRFKTIDLDEEEY